MRTVRLSRFIRSCALAWACAAGVWSGPAAAAQTTDSVPAPALVPPVRLAGTVVDERSFTPVPGALLRLLSPYVGAEPLQFETDASGRYALPPAPAGMYTLLVQSVGYKEFTAMVELGGSERMSMTVMMIPDAVDLDPVIVNVARTSLKMKEFEQRRATGGGGVFFTRSDIEARRPQQTSDLFRQVTGIRVIPDGRGGNKLTLRGGCQPQIYFDGVATSINTGLDFFLRPDDVEAIEVHSTGSVPASYAGAPCGVVLVWTRVPRQAENGQPWWKGFIVLAGMVTFVGLTR